MATENKRIRRRQVSESEWNLLTPEERLFYVINLTDGLDIGFMDSSSNKKRLLGGATFNQSGDLTCSDFESTSITDDGTDVDIDAVLNVFDNIIIDKGATSNVIRLEHDGTNACSLAYASGSGGNVNGADDSGVTKFVIRAYGDSYLNAGGLSINKDTMDSGIGGLDVLGRVRVGTTDAEIHLDLIRDGYNYIGTKSGNTSGAIAFVPAGGSATLANAGLIVEANKNIKVNAQVVCPNLATTAGGAGTERLYWDSSASVVKWG